LTEASFSNPEAGRHYVCGLVSMLEEGLKKYWKIGIHWLINCKEFFPKVLYYQDIEDIAKRIALSG